MIYARALEYPHMHKKHILKKINTQMVLWMLDSSGDAALMTKMVSHAHNHVAFIFITISIELH